MMDLSNITLLRLEGMLCSSPDPADTECHNNPSPLLARHLLRITLDTCHHIPSSSKTKLPT
jgi:hypothetical protein